MGCIVHTYYINDINHKLLNEVTSLQKHEYRVTSLLSLYGEGKWIVMIDIILTYYGVLMNTALIRTCMVSHVMW